MNHFQNLFRSQRTVYFHALSSAKEFSVPNYVLNDERRATNQNSYYEYAYLGSRGSDGHSMVEFYDEETNVLFYTKISKNSVGCWNANKTYAQNTQGNIHLTAFPSDIKNNRNDGTLWILSSQLPAFFNNKALKPDNLNYQIWTGKASEIIKGNKNYIWRSIF